MEEKNKESIPSIEEERKIPLHRDSAPEWIPPPSAYPRYLLHDIIFISAIATCGIVFLGKSIIIPITVLILFAGSIFLPWEISFNKLIQYEKRLLLTLTGEVYHCWTDVPSKYGVWKLHSLVVRNGSSSSSSSSSSSLLSTFPPSTTPSDLLPLVLLHGHSSGAALWECILNKLSVAVREILVPDLPGWGRSPFLPTSSPLLAQKLRNPDTVIEILIDVLEQWAQQRLGDQSIILVGHSFGGFLSIHWAKKYPQRVQQLLLIAPVGIVPLMPDPNAYRWGIFFRYIPPQRIARIFGRLGYLIFRTIYLRTTTEDKRFPDYYYQLSAATKYTGAGDKVVQPFLRFSWGGELWWTRPCLSILMNELSRLPVSFIWGTQDDLLSPTIGVLVHRIRPSTDIYFIHNGLHNPAHTNARAVTDALMHAIYNHRTQLGASLVPESLTFQNSTNTDVTDSLSHVYPFTQVPKQGSGLGVDIEKLLITEQILLSSKSIVNNQTRSILPLPGSTRSITTDTIYTNTNSSLPLYGTGRGYCQACHYLVRLYKSYWRCHCAAWSYNSSIQYSVTELHFQYFLQFLDELYVHGIFNARTSRSIIMYIKTRTPLPSKPVTESSVGWSANDNRNAERIDMTEEAIPPPPSEDNDEIDEQEGYFTGIRSTMMDDLYQSTAVLSYTANNLFEKATADSLPTVQFTGSTDMSIERGKVYLIM